MRENGDVKCPPRRRAREVLAEITEYGRRAQEYAVHELLPLKNDVWLDDDEEMLLTPEQFKERMTLEAAEIVDND
jgi:hypothetical protein